MFGSFSWSDFLSAALWIVGGYYAVAIPALYYRVLVEKLRGNTPKTPDEQLTQKKSYGGLMGCVKSDLQPSRQTVEALDVEISTPPSKESFDSQQFDDLLSAPNTAALLGEIKVVAKVNQENNNSKEEILSVLQTLLSSHAHLNDTQRQLVSEFISQQYQTQCSMQFAGHELESLWPKE